MQQIGEVDVQDMIAFAAQPYHRGGVTRWMVDAAVEWARRGERVWFVCPSPAHEFHNAGPQPRLNTLLDRADPHHRIQRVSPSVGSAYEWGTEQYRASVMLRALRHAIPPTATVILSDDPAIWRVGRAAAGAYRVIGVLHADDEHYYHLAARDGHALAAVVCVSSRIAKNASERLGWPPERLHRIPCGITLSPRPVRSPQCVVPRLIWVGRVDQRQKRVLDLPRILMAISELGIEATLDVVGDGPDRALLEDHVKSSRLGDSVRWHGWSSSEAIQRLLEAADVLLLPSNFEGMPIAVMEALAAGCGVVASQVSGLEDYVGHPLGSLCYRTHAPGDIPSAARCVADLLQVPAVERARSARYFAEAEFSIERCVDRYAQIPLAAPQAEPEGAARLAGARLMGVASLPIATFRRARHWLRTVGSHSREQCLE